MAHRNRTQANRARRGRRRKRRPEMRRMDAYKVRCAAEKWLTRTAWTRKHPVRKKFSWGDVWKSPVPTKKQSGERWWEKDYGDEHE